MALCHQSGSEIAKGKPHNRIPHAWLPSLEMSVTSELSGLCKAGRNAAAVFSLRRTLSVVSIDRSLYRQCASHWCLSPQAIQTPETADCRLLCQDRYAATHLLREVGGGRQNQHPVSSQLNRHTTALHCNRLMSVERWSPDGRRLLGQERYDGGHTHEVLDRVVMCKEQKRGQIRTKNTATQNGSLRDFNDCFGLRLPFRLGMHATDSV